MSHRYYLPTPPVEGSATLDSTEAHHLLHVMRASVGDELTLFDGTGGEYQAQVTELGRKDAKLAVGPRSEVSRELATKLVLGVALPKGDRQKWLVEKLTELGVAELQPLETQRSVADLRGKSLEKLRRSVVEASKQCGRNQLMAIHPPVPFAEFLSIDTGTKLIAHPGGEPVSQVNSTAACVNIIVGPEGGLTDDEVATATDQGWQCVGLGRSILRIETAAVALAAVLGQKKT